MYLDTSITIVKEHIEENLGGNIVVTKNPEIGMVIFVWKKNEKTIHEEHFQYAYSYAELEQVVHPVILGKAFIEAYKNPKPLIEETVEELKKKQTGKKKIEELVEAAVEEAVDLEIKEVVEPVVEEEKEKDDNL